jgi:hypothetical protein
MSIQNRRFGLLLGFAGLFCSAALVAPASAGLSDVVLRVDAQQSRTSGFIELTQSDGWWEGSTFYLQVDEALPIVSDDGTVLGTFGPAAITSYVVPGGRSNPQVNLGFAMQAGDVLTHFTVTSGQVTFSPMTDPTGRASVGITVSDAMGDGAQLLGEASHGNAFLAQYNGLVPNGTTFDEAVSSVTFADPFGTLTTNHDTGFLPIVAQVTDINTMISFSLTAHDLASGTSSFQLVPEPTGLLLLAAGLILVRRR